MKESNNSKYLKIHNSVNFWKKHKAFWSVDSLETGDAIGQPILARF